MKTNSFIISLQQIRNESGFVLNPDYEAKSFVKQVNIELIIL